MATPLLILYGSQTGNAQVRAASISHTCGSLQRRPQPVQRRAHPLPHAKPATSRPRPRPAPQDVAEGIAREGRLLLFEPRVLPMDAYPVQSLPGEAAVVLVTSTTGQVGARRMQRCMQAPHAYAECMRRFWHLLLGLLTLAMHAFKPITNAWQGDPPDNMRRFWRFLLRKSLAADSLAAVRYAVFGLGDSVYVKYNVSWQLQPARSGNELHGTVAAHRRASNTLSSHLAIRPLRSGTGGWLQPACAQQLPACVRSTIHTRP